MITILGAAGFIGSHLAKRLAMLGAEFQAIGRQDVIPAGNLGHIVYCIGVTADFRTRPLETVEAHVCSLVNLIRTHEFDSLLYLSSTRLYRSDNSSDEETLLSVSPAQADDLYNITKLMGESVALNCGRPARIARISNVYGSDFTSDNFLSNVIKQAITTRRVVLRTAPDSAKDYINMASVIEGLIQIATRGREQIYNLASGINVSHGELAQRLQTLTGCHIEFAPDAPTVRFPQINIERMRSEFNLRPSSVLTDLPQLVQLYERNTSGS